MNSKKTFMQNLLVINLKNYSLDIRKIDDKVLIPFHVLESLFSFESYYNVYYLGNSYVGLSYNDYLNIIISVVFYQ